LAIRSLFKFVEELPRSVSADVRIVFLSKFSYPQVRWPEWLSSLDAAPLLRHLFSKSFRLPASLFVPPLTLDNGFSSLRTQNASPCLDPLSRSTHFFQTHTRFSLASFVNTIFFFLVTISRKAPLTNRSVLVGTGSLAVFRSRRLPLRSDTTLPVPLSRFPNSFHNTGRTL